MKCSKRSVAAVGIRRATSSSSTGTLRARDADPASHTFAAAQTAKQRCTNTCRARIATACPKNKYLPSSVRVFSTIATALLAMV